MLGMLLVEVMLVLLLVFWVLSAGFSELEIGCGILIALGPVATRL